MMSTKPGSLLITAAVVFLFLLPRYAQSQTPQAVVFQLVDVKQGPLCKSWGDVRSSKRNGGQMTRGDATNTDYQWTSLPQQVGPEGFTTISGVSRITTDARRVTVAAPSIPVRKSILEFEANPQRIKKGQSSTLTWKTENCQDCFIVPPMKGQPAPANGTMVVTPHVSTVYILECTCSDPPNQWTVLVMVDED